MIYINFIDEIWKDIPEWENRYQISNQGRVKSLDFMIGNRLYEGQILKQQLNKQGFYYVCFSKNQQLTKYLVHQLVARAFIPEYKPKKRLLHKNKDASDNRLENLSYEPKIKKPITWPRICKRCKQAKGIEEYSIRKVSNRPRTICKKCMSEMGMEKYYSDPIKTKEENKKSYWKNRDKRLKNHKKWYQLNKKENNRKNTIKNRERAKKDINYRLRRIYKQRLHNAFTWRGLSKNRRSCLNFMGCSPEELKNHLQSQFKPWMNWNNYGKNGWHLGHIVCCELFDFTDENQVKKCFNYTNICPENGHKNITKQDLLPDGRYARNLTPEEKLNLINQFFDENNHLKPEIKSQYIEKFYS